MMTYDGRETRRTLGGPLFEFSEPKLTCTWL